MKKLGILTHYENSTNYGGSLQAYALCKAVEQFGWQAQQIRIDCFKDNRNLIKSPGDHGFAGKLKKLVKKPAKAVCMLIPSYRKKRQEKARKHRALLQVFDPFNKNRTPHSEQLFTAATVGKANEDYDAFAVGSDQVWNPIWYFEPFFLTFTNKPKFSYAASIAQDALPNEVKAVYKNHLNDFIGVSVREENAVKLLEDISPVTVNWVLDPTLLLSQEEWSEIAAEPAIEKPYLFCYFLGDDAAPRKAAARYAAERGLCLVNIPNATGLMHQNDENFGDVCLPDPSPEEFIGLIKHAQCIFTDSFHASVFSIIQKRQFFTFPRQGFEAMSGRIYSLTALFNMPQQFLDTPEKVAALSQLPALDYSTTPVQFDRMKAHSLKYLHDCLLQAEGQ